MWQVMRLCYFGGIQAQAFILCWHSLPHPNMPARTYYRQLTMMGFLKGLLGALVHLSAHKDSIALQGLSEEDTRAALLKCTGDGDAA